MHLETLDAVHQESKRLPPIPKVFLALLFLVFFLFNVRLLVLERLQTA